MTVRIIPGDCRGAMAALHDEGTLVDSVVCDPPYHLTSIVKRFGNGQAPAKFGKDGRYARLSGGFMQQKWDAPDAAPIDPEFAHWFAGFVDGEGCFSVHKKKVNGCETYDCQFSIQLRKDDAPIIQEIKRQLGGIGTIAFPKTKDNPGNAKPQVRYCISSQRDCWRLREIFSVFPLRAKKARDFEIWSAALDAWIAHEPGKGWEDVAYFRNALMDVRRYGAAYHPSQLFHYQWAREAFKVLKPGGHLVAFSGTRTYHRMAAAIEDAGFEVRDCISWLFGQGFPKSHNLSGEHEGWGTALKPACELIVLARKPLEGTVAQNVLQHGTGAMNIDGCRISAEESTARPSGGALGILNDDGWEPEIGKMTGGSALGRWPANLCHDGSEEVVGMFPNTPGQHGDLNETGKPRPIKIAYGDMGPPLPHMARGDSGSAARFFYCSKADSDDRAGSKHPTVKPVDLMRWLVRLVTPKGGTVLDPFAGTGTTGQAALMEGMKAVLIEQSPEYVADIERRLAQPIQIGGLV